MVVTHMATVMVIWVFIRASRLASKLLDRALVLASRLLNRALVLASRLLNRALVLVVDQCWIDG